MIKKLICVALFVMILSSSFVGYASHGSAWLDGYEEYSNLFKAINMFPAEFEDASKPATRADFIMMLTKLMNVSNPPVGESPFSDVMLSGELAASVNAAITLKIISDGEMFYPESAVTFNQAVKMAVVALGYNDEAIAKGGYPGGYVSVANRIGLDVPYTEKEMTVSDAVSFLGQVCETYVNDITAISQNENGYGYTSTEKSTFLYKYQKIYTVSGVVEASQESYLDDSSLSLAPRRISIKGVTFELSDGVECPLGYRATIFVKEDKGLCHKVVFASLKDNKVVTLVPDNEIQITKNTIKYITSDGKEKKLNCDSMKSVLYNGKAFANFVPSDISVREGRVIVIDNDSDGTYDVISILVPTYLVVDYTDVVNGIIYDEHFTNNIFLDSDDILYTSDVPLKSIKSSDVLEVFVSKDGRYADIHLLKQRISGIVEGYTSDNELVLGGEVYEATEYFNTYYSNIVTPGMDVNVIVNDANQCVSIRSYDAGNVKYGYLDGVKSKSGIDDSVMVKIFDESGEVLILPLSAKVRIDDDSMAAMQAKDILEDETGNLVKFRIDTHGAVRAVETEDEELGLYIPSGDGTNILKRYNFPGYDTNTTIPYKVTGYFVPHFIIDSGTRIFCIAESETDDTKKFTIGNGTAFLANDTQVVSSSLYAYNVNEVGRAEALVYKTDTYAATIDETSSSGLVSKFAKILNDEGDEVYKIEIYYADRFDTYLIKPDASFITSDDSTFVPGDFIRFNVDANGYVTAVSKDFDYASKTVLGSTQDNTRNHYYYGDVYLLGDSSTAIRRPDGTMMYIPMAINDCGYVRGGTVSTASKDIVKTYKHVGSSCSKVLVKCYYSSPQAIYIFD